MVRIDVMADRVRFEVLGAHKLWALRRQIEVPLASITSVAHDPEAAGKWPPGLRLPGSFLPGVITAGSYRTRYNGWEFWDVSKPADSIVVGCDTTSEWRRVVVQVEDPAAAVAAIEAARG
ncbi:MAG: hypothetical protein ACI8PZ_001422 [Myxococcota bacterium]|jgi:hypothetical protein